MAVNINVPSQVKTYANLAAFPATGALKTIYIAEDTNKTYRWTGSVYTEISASAAMTWGAIGGTLSNQTDLQSALDAKVPTSRTLTINGVTQDLSANRTFTISTGITIGSTAIASGVVGRVLFEGAGNVVQESSSLFWDATNNRLGVGTDTPTTIVHINGNTAGTAPSLQIRQQANTTPTWFAVRNTDNLASAGAISLDLGISGGAGQFFTGTAQGDIVLKAYSNGSTSKFFVGATSGSSSNMVLFPSGNTGLNTTTDAGFRLDVNGTARVVATHQIYRNNQVGAIDLNLYNGQSGWQGGMYYNTGAGGSGQRLTFYAGGALGSADRMSIFSSGNVGINTTTDAGFRLDVNGTARVSGNLAFVTGNTYINSTSNHMWIAAVTSTSTDIQMIPGRQVNINNTGTYTAQASAILQTDSTTKGFLPPRMTTTQKNAIATPAAGLVVYDTTLNKLCVYTTAWETVTSL